MANSLLKHPLLKHLEYRDLKNPTNEGIKRFLNKRRLKFNRLSLTSMLMAIFYIMGLWLLPVNLNWDEVIFSIMLFVVALIFKKDALESKMSDEEINIALNEYQKTNSKD